MKNKLIESTVIKLFSEAAQDTSEITFEDIDKIKKDIDVNSALNKLNRNVSGRDYFIKSLNKEISEEELVKIEELFSGVKFNRVFNEILEARLYGYSCFEIVYDEEYKLDTLIPLPVKNVKYDAKDKVWRVEAGNNKIEIIPDKFLLCIHRWKPNKVTGNSILENCNTSFIDKSLFRNQLRGIAKKYGDTIIVFGYDPEEDEKETEKKADALKKMEGKTAVGVPVDFMGRSDGSNLKDAIEIIKLSDLNPEVYTKLEEKEKIKLIQNILGSTLTMEVGAVGSQALGTVHMEAEEQVVDECCAFISDCLQNLLNVVLPLHGYNPKDFYFSLEKKRDVFKELEVESKTELVQTQKIENIAKLVAAGYPLTKEYVAEQLGIDPSQIQDVVLEFASKKKDLDSLLDRKRVAKDKVLKQAEESFLKSFSTNLKEQLISQVTKGSKTFLKPIEFNFDTFYDHTLIIKIIAYLEEGEDILEFEEEVNPFEMKFHEAIKYAIDKRPKLIDEIDIMQEEVRAQAFWVKRSTEITATEKLMKDLQKNLDNGGTYKDWLKDISNVADRVGMGDDGWYSANVYRTNMLSFYNAGVYQQQMDNIENQPYWLYDGIADGRQSDICKELDGKVYAADDPIWARIYPPNHWFCRSGVIALSEEEVEAMGLKVTKPSKKIKEMKMESFEGNPANSYWKKLEKNVIIKEKKSNSMLEKIKESLKEKQLYPETLAGQKRGNTMTRAEANEGRANPNFALGEGYRINCQTCVVSFEARLRGYDVEALPNTRGSMLEKLSRKTNLAWIDPVTGKNPEYLKDDTANNSKKFFEFMEKSIEKNSRYTIEFAWKGRGNNGHIISLDRDENGLLRLYDPQTGESYDENGVKQYLKNMKYETTIYGKKYPYGPKILRIDDKIFNMEVVNQILKGVVK